MSPRQTKAPRVPPLSEREKPGLSETLTGPIDPLHCQSCSAEHTAANPLGRWLEHDAHDQLPAVRHVVVVLCARCSNRLIERHARLYRVLWPNEPQPGCMSVCMTCAHRRGVQCYSLDERLAFTWRGEITRAHINYGGGRGEFRTIYPSPAQTCSGYAAAMTTQGSR